MPLDQSVAWWTGETLGPEVSIQPIPKMLPEALGLVMRTNSRADTIQQMSRQAGKFIKAEIHSWERVSKRAVHTRVWVCILYSQLLTRGGDIHYLGWDFLEAGWSAFSALFVQGVPAYLVLCLVHHLGSGLIPFTGILFWSAARIVLWL